MSAKSTTVIGNEFRDEVAALLDLMPSVSNVQTEVTIGSQDVDIVYEENTSFRRMRIACECKCYGKPLTRKEIAEKIHPRYRTLLENHLVDAVRILSPLSIGAKARAYIDEDRRLSFTTGEELEHNLIDFRMYKRALASMYREQGLDQYYVRPKLGDQTDLEEKILAWIGEDSAKPIAILAGYGMGKTSFALRLVYQATERQADDHLHRIPIYIPLAEISAEQGLEGLLGKLLAAQYRLPNYHFGAFMELNRRGHFLIVLDGFDEMKHTMSWTEFQHNFTELNRLVPRTRKSSSSAGHLRSFCLRQPAGTQDRRTALLSSPIVPGVLGR